MDSASIKKNVIDFIEGHADEIIATGDQIASHPELGFQEYKTSELVKERFGQLGLSYQEDLAVTGIKANLTGGAGNKCRVAYMAELDALTCPAHPKADPATGAAHACGHHVQTAVMLAVAQAMVETKAVQYLGGDIAFISVPAEELGQFEFRQSLRKKGIISFLTGKQEMLAKGALDDIDMAMMMHMQMPKVEGKVITIGGSMNGAIAKNIFYKGVTAHAGSGPHLGVNALNAAMIGLQAIHAQRETFKEEDCVRVHPMITKGGTLVNSVPDDVRLELFVRAKNVDALTSACEKVDRAFKAGADAIGATVTIENIPGYMPRKSDENLDSVFEANAADILGKNLVAEGPHLNGSTDMGDLSQVMPTIHPWIHVVKGKLHAEDFEIENPYLAYVQSAKIAACTLVDLLVNGAQKALEIKAKSNPPMTKEQWLAKWEELVGK